MIPCCMFLFSGPHLLEYFSNTKPSCSDRITEFVQSIPVRLLVDQVTDVNRIGIYPESDIRHSSIGKQLTI